MSDTFDHELDAYEDEERREYGDEPYYPDLPARVTAALSDREPKVVVSCVDFWTYYKHRSCSSTVYDWQTLQNRGAVTGKYLFFCPHKEWLVDLVRDEIELRGFMVGKISNTPSGKDYVLCLYWEDDSRKFELARRYPNSDECELKYRFWKSDADTNAGKYSDIHKKNQRRFK